MSILDQATKHFSDRVSASNMFIIEVDEWGDGSNSAQIHIKPETTADRERYMPAIMNNLPSGFVDLLICRCRTAGGTKLFKPADRDKLINNVDPKVIMKVATEILRYDTDNNGEGLEEEKKD